VGQVLRKSHRLKRGHKRLYASSLAFKTLLALVPALALIMAVLASDAFSQKREQLLDQIVDAIYPVQIRSDNSFLDPDEPKNLQQLNQAGKQQIRISVRKFASHAQKVGIIGFIGFIVVVFLLMRDVEGSFNFLWGVEKARPLFAQMVRHATLFIGLPLLAVLFLVLKGLAGSWNVIHPSFHHWLFVKALPFAVLWAACSWMYLWVPNAKVEKKAAVLTGLLAAFLLESARWGMNWYTLKVLEKSHVYGALWMVPIILIWFYLSWTVILFGAEVAYFIQQYGNETNRIKA
jgi:membrane protein